MKGKITLLLGFFSALAFGQEINSELPVISPQSPTTNDLGKYGEVQVNESTGTISPSIPLFDYKAGKITIPITLNYSGNGVRVNQDPTWAGVNWNINPGGVITRVVKDLADEKTLDTLHRVYLSADALDNLSGVRQVNSDGNFVTTTDWYTKMNFLANSTVDSEADIFNYNFLGYSGSFFLDKQNKVQLIKYDKEVLITFYYQSDNKSIFTIKTPEGNEYLFGGELGSESSRSWVNSGAGSTVNVPFTQNAFYLTKITFLTGGTVDFEYDNYDTTCQLVKTGIQENASISYPLGQYPCNNTVKTMYNEVENSVKLKKITNSFNNEIVEFQTTFHGTCNRLVRLNSILLKNSSALAKKINLNYLVIDNEPTNSLENKYFLEKVDFYNNSNEFEYDYELEYTTPDLFPSKDSFAQDHLGYYNGKDSNATLLPKTSNTLLNQNCFFGLADREADLASSLIGSLETIKYPTGGYTMFDYELPYKGQEYNYQTNYSYAFYRNPEDNNESSSHTCVNNINSYSQGFFFPNGGFEAKNIVQNVTVSATVNVQINGNYSHPVIAKIIAVNQNQQQTTSHFTINASTYQNDTVSQVLSLQLTPGQYVFKFVIEAYNTDSHSCSGQGENTSNSIFAVAQFAMPNVLENIHYPGLRIQKIRSFDNNSNENITRYYYNKLDSLNVEAFTFDPKYVQKTWRLNLETVWGTFDEVYNLNVNSLNNVFNNDMGSFTYKHVTVSYGGNAFEKGGKEMTFIKNPNTIPYLYKTHPNMIYDFEVYIFGMALVGLPTQIPYSANLPVDYSTMVSVGNNISYQNSVLSEEKIFNNNKKILSSKIFNYDGTESAVSNNIKIANIINVPSNGSVNITRNSYFLYKTRSYNYRLLSTVATQYFGADFSNEMTSTTFYTYSSDKVSLPSTIETTTSTGENKIVAVYYPSDAASMGDLPPADVGLLNSMQSQHNVAEIVETEEYSGTELLEKKLKSYSSFGGKILPKNISINKGENAFRERIEFLEYDTNGNPTLVSMKNGMKTKYVYNQNQQVVLKIENYTTGSVDDGLNATDCHYQNLFPTCLVTKYIYSATTNNLIKVIDPKCDIVVYYYDKFNRLEKVQDKQHNVLSENNYHFKN